jgi:hypothetical protein
MKTAIISGTLPLVHACWNSHPGSRAERARRAAFASAVSTRSQPSNVKPNGGRSLKWPTV